MIRVKVNVESESPTSRTWATAAEEIARVGRFLQVVGEIHIPQYDGEIFSSEQQIFDLEQKRIGSLKVEVREEVCQLSHLKQLLESAPLP